ncbi:MAG TPA: hypothetical protein VMY42_19850, partial [Thermoguttaceae bacterium]|nr:hypothetical protein [Thermoguttaceae bacterium]
HVLTLVKKNATLFCARNWFNPHSPTRPLVSQRLSPREAQKSVAPVVLHKAQEARGSIVRGTSSRAAENERPEQTREAARAGIRFRAEIACPIGGTP